MRRKLAAMVRGEKTFWRSSGVKVHSAPIPRPNAREKKLLAIATEVFGLLGREPQGGRMLALQKKLLELYPRAKIQAPEAVSAWQAVPPTDEVPVPSLRQIDWVAEQASKWKEKETEVPTPSLRQIDWVAEQALKRKEKKP